MIVYFIKSPYTHEFRWLAVDDNPIDGDYECIEKYPRDYYDERDIDLVKKKLREHFSTKDFIVKYVGGPNRPGEPNQFTITFFNDENNDFFKVLSSNGLEI
jgi:hypothetical protein